MVWLPNLRMLKKGSHHLSNLYYFSYLNMYFCSTYLYQMYFVCLDLGMLLRLTSPTYFCYTYFYTWKYTCVLLLSYVSKSGNASQVSHPTQPQCWRNIWCPPSWVTLTLRHFWNKRKALYELEFSKDQLIVWLLQPPLYAACVKQVKAPQLTLLTPLYPVLLHIGHHCLFK